MWQLKDRNLARFCRLSSYYAVNKQEDSFTYKDVTYDLSKEGEDFYTISSGGTQIGMASKDIVNTPDNAEEVPYDLRVASLKAYTNGETSFTLNGTDYTLDDEGNVMQGDNVVAYISRFVVQSKENGVAITRNFKEELEKALETDDEEFKYTGEDGEEHLYRIEYKADTNSWSVLQETETYVYDSYAEPSSSHWLGLDKNGMDMMTRLMYGGRVSLIIGFIVVFIAAFLGIVFGGISGYFGGWVDNLIMRIVDIFYCIPSMPLIIIIGASMDAMQLDPADSYALSDADPRVPQLAFDRTSGAWPDPVPA